MSAARLTARLLVRLVFAGIVAASAIASAPPPTSTVQRARRVVRQHRVRPLDSAQLARTRHLGVEEFEPGARADEPVSGPATAEFSPAIPLPPAAVVVAVLRSNEPQHVRLTSQRSDFGRAPPFFLAG